MKTSTILLHSAIILLMPVFCFCQVNTTDSLALVDLYKSTNGKNWTSHDNWLTKKPVRTWFGVMANDSNRVIVLILAGNNLAGTIPSSLGNIAHLTVLNLQGNEISGTLPTSLGNLSGLGELYIDGNQITGAIPNSFKNLTGLEYFSASINKLSGKLTPLNNLIHLKQLNLMQNRLTGSIPSSFGRFKDLQVLELAFNNLSGTIPPSLGKLENLQLLYLDGNKLTGSIPGTFGQLKNLFYLFLNGNNLSGDVSNLIDSFSIYTLVYVGGNKYNFTAGEIFAEYFPNVQYGFQQAIKISKSGNKLSVTAGGTLSNDTFKLYKNGALLKTKIGDSTFLTSGAGKYNIVISNSVATKLILFSDTITIGTPDVPDVSINDTSAKEDNTGTKTLKIPVRLNEAAVFNSSVNYTTADSTAKASQDYVSKSGTINFAVGQLTDTIRIVINGDTKNEPDETFKIILSQPVNISISDTVAMIKIKNDDSAGFSKAEDNNNLSTNKFSFSVSPNPAKDFINIVSSADVTNAQLRITGINGETLYAAKQNFVAGQKLKIPLTQLPNEVLIVTVGSNNGYQKFKVIKE